MYNFYKICTYLHNKKYVYLGPGPTISGQEDGVQNSEMVPYIKLMCSKNPMAKSKIVTVSEMTH